MTTNDYQLKAMETKMFNKALMDSSIQFSPFGTRDMHLEYDQGFQMKTETHFNKTNDMQNQLYAPPSLEDAGNVLADETNYTPSEADQLLKEENQIIGREV